MPSRLLVVKTGRVRLNYGFRSHSCKLVRCRRHYAWEDAHIIVNLEEANLTWSWCKFSRGTWRVSHSSWRSQQRWQIDWRQREVEHSHLMRKHSMDNRWWYIPWLDKPKLGQTEWSQCRSKSWLAHASIDIRRRPKLWCVKPFEDTKKIKLTWHLYLLQLWSKAFIGSRGDFQKERAGQN